MENYTDLQRRNFSTDSLPICSICLEPRSTQTAEFSCKHIFDLQCIKDTLRAWLGKMALFKCPLCRARVKEIKYTSDDNDVVFETFSMDDGDLKEFLGLVRAPDKESVTVGDRTGRDVDELRYDEMVWHGMSATERNRLLRLREVRTRGARPGKLWEMTVQECWGKKDGKILHLHRTLELFMEQSYTPTFYLHSYITRRLRVTTHLVGSDSAEQLRRLPRSDRQVSSGAAEIRDHFQRYDRRNGNGRRRENWNVLTSQANVLADERGLRCIARTQLKGSRTYDWGQVELSRKISLSEYFQFRDYQADAEDSLRALRLAREEIWVVIDYVMQTGNERDLGVSHFERLGTALFDMGMYGEYGPCRYCRQGHMNGVCQLPGMNEDWGEPRPRPSVLRSMLQSLGF